MTTATATSPELAEVRGPSALSGDWRRFLRLTWLIASTDYRLTYFGSVLGYLWSFMQPLLFFGVLYVVFGLVLTTSALDFPVLPPRRQALVHGPVRPEVSPPLVERVDPC